MYSVLRCRASTSFLVMLLSTMGCGSSPLGGPIPVDIPIAEDSLSDAGPCHSTEEISSEPYVYRCDTKAGALFVATFKDCSVSEKFSFQATTRQLFVGVTGLTIISQEPVSFGPHKVLQTVVTGTLDAQPLAVSTFTLREQGCVNDVVVWKAEDKPLKAGELSRSFSALSQSIAKHVVGATVEPAHADGEPAHAEG